MDIFDSKLDKNKSNIIKKALIVVNLAGFLNFLWEDIDLLQSMGYEVSIAMNGKLMDGTNAIEISMLDSMKINHYQIDFDTKSPLDKKNAFAYKQLRKLLKKSFDVIHCHTPIVGVLTRIAANSYRKKGVKVIYTTHGFNFTDRTPKKNWYLYFTIEKIMSLFCDAIITINHEDYNNAKKMFCKNIFLIPSVGFDYKKFSNVKINRNKYRKSIGVNENDIMILAVGKLSVLKNHQIIIKAISELIDKEKYKLVICGNSTVNSTTENDLKLLSKKLNVRVQMLGHRHDMPEINNCADIVVLPSLREGFGMAGIEAMAAGVPVIGSDVQGIREYVIPGKTGYLCNPMKYNEFADAITKIANMDNENKEIMKVECKTMAQKFDILKSKEAMEKIYKFILERDN